MRNLDEFTKLTPGEQSLYKWQMNQHGGFYTALWKAISTADEGNLMKIARGFPGEVRAYKRFIYEMGWWEETLRRVRDGVVAAVVALLLLTLPSISSAQTQGLRTNTGRSAVREPSGAVWTRPFVEVQNNTGTYQLMKVRCIAVTQSGRTVVGEKTLPMNPGTSRVAPPVSGASFQKLICW